MVITKQQITIAYTHDNKTIQKRITDITYHKKKKKKKIRLTTIDKRGYEEAMHLYNEISQMINCSTVKLPLGQH